MINAYALTLAALLLTAGSLADLYGRRLLFAIGIVIFTGGSLCCGLAHELLFARPLAGRAGHRRRDHVRDVARAARAGLPRHATAASRSACSARSPGSRSRSARCSAARSPAGSRGAGSSSSTSRSGSPRCSMTVLRVDESRNPRRAPARLGRLRRRSAPALAALVFGLIESQRRRLGLDARWSRRSRVGACCWSCSSCRARPGRADVRPGLLRVPTFVGGLVAAWAISASVFSLLTYLVIYLQNEPRLSGVADRRALPAADRRDLRRRGHRRAAHRPACRGGC